MYGSCHVDFSDIYMILPPWLAMALRRGQVRNPHETAKEIADHTIHFLDKVFKKQEDRKLVKGYK